MDLNEIKAFIGAMAASDLAEMEVGRGAWTLRLTKRPSGTPVIASVPERGTPPKATFRQGALSVPAPVKPVDGAEIRAPLAGIVYLHPGPNELPFVATGAPVAAGATVCVIEAMKMFNEVRSERGGTVETIFVASGVEVEAGQLLMRIA
jgi:acetyl-CoA carboxylase biotin carboxyl carrier protein